MLLLHCCFKLPLKTSVWGFFLSFINWYLTTAVYTKNHSVKLWRRNISALFGTNRVVNSQYGLKKEFSQSQPFASQPSSLLIKFCCTLKKLWKLVLAPKFNNKYLKLCVYDLQHSWAGYWCASLSKSFSVQSSWVTGWLEQIHPSSRGYDLFVNWVQKTNCTDF